MESDEDLMLAWHHGRAQALPDLVVRYHTPIYNYLFRLTCHHALADDLTQDCFERLVSSHRLYQYPRPFRPWLYAIATNSMRRHFESAYYRHTLLVEHIDSTSQAEAADTPHQALELWLGRQDMLALLTCLTPAHRQVIVLRYVEDFTLAQIAAILQTPLGTVKTRLVRALDRLRTHLVQQADPTEAPHAATI